MSESAAPASAEPADMRPLVGAPTSHRAIVLFSIALGLGGGLLFAKLEARRSALTAPAVTAPADINAGQLAPPPDLVIPPDYADLRPATKVPGATSTSFADQRPAPSRVIAQPSPVVRIAKAPSLETNPLTPPRPANAGFGPTLPAQAGPTFAGPQVVYQAPAGRNTATNTASTGDKPGSSAERVNATRLENPMTTVPKGTLVQAVLETALDSTRAGAARAVVTQDVRGFDGTRVLIPRGSRLYGEYKADLTAGQNRALIQWQRLLRPDGVIINLDSPSADPLGRAGVRGKVNTHFFERFGGAILQTALNIGTNLATRTVTNQAVLVALPGSAQALTPTVNPADVKPTLKIRQGTSVSVFVARDLDFTAVEP